MGVKFIEQISHRIRSLPEVFQWQRKSQASFVVWDQPGIKQVPSCAVEDRFYPKFTNKREI